MTITKVFNLRNQHRLILVVGQHVDVSAIGNGENVRRNFRATLASVQPGASGRVHGEPLVRVDGHTEETRVSLLIVIKLVLVIQMLVTGNLLPKLIVNRFLDFCL